MVTDNFVYRVVGYGEGDFSVRYYPNEDPNGLSVGIIRIRVNHNVGPLNKIVVVILSMDIDNMLELYKGDNPEEFVQEIRRHATSLFTTD
jgi:hypothetical protein